MRSTNPANRYLQAAAGRGGRFRNADGFFDRDVVNAGRGSFYADATAAAPAAAPAATPGNKPTSQPYVIVVASTSGAAVDNFDILGAYEYLTTPPTGWSWDAATQNLSNGSLTIKSGVPNITYKQMLAQFQATPFTVGQTYISSATATQIDQVLDLQVTDANGRQASNPMIPLIDPYQFQTNRISFTQKFRMDGNTKITIASVLPNATVYFYFYPMDNFNAARALADGNVVKTYGQPNIVRAQQVYIGQPNQ